jgi:hypothetical protein
VTIAKGDQLFVSAFEVVLFSWFALMDVMDVMDGVDPSRGLSRRRRERCNYRGIALHGGPSLH